MLCVKLLELKSWLCHCCIIWDKLLKILWPRFLGCVVFVVQLLSYVQLFETPQTAACQACLSLTISQSLLKLMSIESIMPSNHLILCHPLLLLPSIFANIRGFSKEFVEWRHLYGKLIERLWIHTWRVYIYKLSMVPAFSKHSINVSHYYNVLIPIMAIFEDAGEKHIPMQQNHIISLQKKIKMQDTEANSKSEYRPFMKTYSVT